MFQTNSRLPINEIYGKSKRLGLESTGEPSYTSTLMTDSTLEYGEQPIAQIMRDAGIKANDLVNASKVPMTHKMVARACKGRKLTTNTKNIVLRALQLVTGKTYSFTDLFNY